MTEAHPVGEKAAVIITRVDSNREPFHYMSIDLRWPAAGGRLTIEMSMEEFAMALTGRLVPDVSARWRTTPTGRSADG